MTEETPYWKKCAEKVSYRYKAFEGETPAVVPLPYPDGTSQYDMDSAIIAAHKDLDVVNTNRHVFEIMHKAEGFAIQPDEDGYLRILPNAEDTPCEFRKGNYNTTCECGRFKGFFYDTSKVDWLKDLNLHTRKPAGFINHENVKKVIVKCRF